MASPIMPRLEELGNPTNRFNVSGSFVERFVKQHSDDWGTAEKHWEIVVSRVLNTDAVDAGASPRRAIYQAVVATVTLLDASALRDRCPVCPDDAPSGLMRRRRRYA
jgi:Family of unknown function (DUF6313)